VTALVQHPKDAFTQAVVAKAPDVGKYKGRLVQCEEASIHARLCMYVCVRACVCVCVYVCPCACVSTSAMFCVLARCSVRM